MVQVAIKVSKLHWIYRQRTNETMAMREVLRTGDMFHANANLAHVPIKMEVLLWNSYTAVDFYVYIMLPLPLKQFALPCKNIPTLAIEVKARSRKNLP